MNTSGPYMCERTGLTCILAALNNYSGYDVFTVNPLPRPTTVADFVQLFGTLTGEEMTLICIPGRVFHALYLGGVCLPGHIFAIRGAHIYNYNYADFYWWRIDTKYGRREKIHVGELGLAEDTLYLPYLKSDLAKLREEIRSWKIPRENTYYADIRTTILNCISSD
jgi:hypothetical protein